MPEVTDLFRFSRGVNAGLISIKNAGPGAKLLICDEERADAQFRRSLGITRRNPARTRHLPASQFTPFELRSPFADNILYLSV